MHRWGFNEASGAAIDDPGTFDGTFVGAATRSTSQQPVLGDNQCDYAPVANGTSCSDSDACNGEETCQAGICEAGTPVVCDDTNPCTDDACVPATGACEYTADDTNVCADGTVCNGDEVCSGGACQTGTPLDCNDTNVCTDDSCDAVLGCQHANNTASCDDGNACTSGDTCASGTCLPGTPLTCDDADVCNGLETCDPQTGCVAGTPLACDDGSWCNGLETCDTLSGCQPGAAPDCDDGVTCTADSCNDTTDTCDHADSCLTGTHCDLYLSTCIANGSQLSLPASVSTGTGGDVMVPITATTIDGVISMDLAFTYDPALFQATGVFKSPLTEMATLTYNVGMPGMVDISLFHSMPMAGTGTILWVGLHAIGSEGGTTPLTWTEHQLNEGGIPTTATDGSAEVQACTARLSIPDDALGVTGTEAVVPVLAFPAAGVGVDLTVEYNPEQLQVQTVTATPITAGASLNYNASTPGRLVISIFSTSPLEGEGPLVDIHFLVQGTAPPESPVYLTQGMIDEGLITSCLDAGMFRTCAIDCNDGSYCTFDTCEAGPACGHASSGLCSVGGTALFYRDSDDGNEPSNPAKPVPNVTIDLSGSDTGQATTDADGLYAFAGAFGNVVTTPSRVDTFTQEAVSSQDAVQAAKHQVGLITLTPNQFIAADVTNNGEVSSFDASAIAKYSVGLIVPTGMTGDHFPVAAAHAGDWQFVPAQHQHPSIDGSLTGDDFVGILYGDVTGNWTADSESMGPFAPLAAPSTVQELLPARTGPAVAYFAEPPTRIPGTNDWKVVLGLRDADGILGLDLTLKDAGLALKGARAVGIAAQFTAVSNAAGDAGKVALFATAPMRGDGPFLELILSGDRATLERLGTVLSLRANEGAIPTRWGPPARDRRPDKLVPRAEGRP